MNGLNPYSKVLSDRYDRASPAELVALLHDGIITRMRQAKERFQFAQHHLAKEALVRSMRIADVLMDHLNTTDGGEVANNLEQLYFFVIQQLSAALKKNEAGEELDNIVRVLEPLRDSWNELAKRTPAND